MAEVILDEIEVRVLGSLMEKQITTPDYYPMSLNALTHACNQKSSRDPVVSFDDSKVAGALDRLREKGLAQMVRSVDYRVPKYQQAFNQLFNFSPQEVAVLCVLMLRGSQTVAEIRGHAAPLFQFEELSEVETTLQRLMTREPQPLVARIPRPAGLKEFRYAHLLSGAIKVEALDATRIVEASRRVTESDEERIARLEEDIAGLRQGLEELSKQLADFKKQFE